MSLNFNVKFIEFVKNNTGKETCIIRMFGITANGNSVVAHVHNFTPYFYVEVDAKRVNLQPNDLIEIKNMLNNWSQSGEPCVKHVELVDKASVMHYQQGLGKFLKIYTTLPKFVNQLRSAFENSSFRFKSLMIFSSVTYESNLPYALRFMIDNEIVGMSWIKVCGGKYRKRLSATQ